MFGSVQDFLVDVKPGNKPPSFCSASLSLHREAEREQGCTTGKEAAWKSCCVSLVHACPKLSEGTGSAAEHWAKVVDWTIGLH